MEAIKTTEDLRFILRYADGTEKEVNKGILFEECEDGGINLHIGTDNQIPLFAAIYSIAGDIYRNALRLARGGKNPTAEGSIKRGNNNG